jgi:hypothetical protein
MTRNDILRDVLRVPLRTFNQLIARGEFPRHTAKVGCRRVWPREVIHAYVVGKAGGDASNN